MSSVIHEAHEAHEEEMEGPYELPAGWRWTTLEHIYKIVGGGTPSTAVPEYWGGDIPWITSADITGLHDIRPRKTITVDAIKNSATNLVPEGSLIVVTRVGLGKVALTKTPLCFSQDSHALIGDPSVVDPEYAIYFLSEAVQTFKYHNQGTTIAGVTKKQLSMLPFALPPIDEQRGIVAKIEELFSSLDAGIASLRRVRAALKRYRAAVLKAACEGRLVAQDPSDEPADKLLARILAERRAKWEADLVGKGKDPKKAKYEEPKGPETEGLPELPKGWCWATLPQLGELARGKSKHRPRNDPRLYGGPYPFIQTGEIRQAGDTISSYSQTYNEIGLAQSRIWPQGTLCITIAANIAETAMLGLDACFPDSVVGFVASKQVCTSEFIMYFIRSVRENLERYAPATAQKNINLDTLQNLPIALPPLIEQLRIVAEVEQWLSLVSQLEKAVEANLVRAERLRQAILRRAFEGQLAMRDPA